MTQEQSSSGAFDMDYTDVVEIPFVDHTGGDLGTFHVDPRQSVANLISKVVVESGLPATSPNGAPRRYEAYSRGRKLPPTVPVEDAGLAEDEEIEVFPSVTTG